MDKIAIIKISKEQEPDSIGLRAISYVGSRIPLVVASSAIAPSLVDKFVKYDTNVDYKEHKSKNLSKLKKSMGIDDSVKVFKNTNEAIRYF